MFASGLSTPANSARSPCRDLLTDCPRAYDDIMNIIDKLDYAEQLP
jgi:hypothetical protein